MFDCHLHSSFSGDSEMPAETACKKAIDLGLDGIAFTDHLDYDYPGYDDFFIIDFEKYSRYIDALKAEYRGRLQILKGIEVGIQPHVIAQSEDIVKSFDFDFVIASTHIIDSMDPYVGNFYDGKNKKQADERYLQEVLHAVTNFKNYDIVGHIGYIRRYNRHDDKTLRYADYSDLLDEILKTVVKDGKGIEINTSGYRKGALGSPIPDYDIVKRYKELGGSIITVGSDAHCPEHMGIGFELAKENLISLGFEYIAHFEGRKPVFEKIK